MEEKKDNIEYKRHKCGLYVPNGIPEGGKNPPIGFSRELQESKDKNGTK